jgi:hypothetical protein
MLSQNAKHYVGSSLNTNSKLQQKLTKSSKKLKISGQPANLSASSTTYW